MEVYYFTAFATKASRLGRMVRTLEYLIFGEIQATL